MEPARHADWQGKEFGVHDESTGIKYQAFKIKDYFRAEYFIADTEAIKVPNNKITPGAIAFKKVYNQHGTFQIWKRTVKGTF